MSSQPIRVVGYSERGLVNALVHYLRYHQEALPDFLRSFEWLVPHHQDGNIEHIITWFDECEVTFIVESSFAQFGDPDLILVLAPRDQTMQRHLFFIEGKVVPWEKSAKPNSEGMSLRGFNSSINGQLSLRYRLARALAAYDTEAMIQGSGYPPALVEPPELHQAAKKELKDPIRKPRHLQKPQVLQTLVPMLKTGGPESASSFIEAAFLLSITADSENPLPRQSEDALPLYPANDEYEAKCAEIAKTRTGWTGWKKLAERIEGLGEDGDFKEVYDLS